MSSIAGRIVLYGRMIRFTHSVFALPFALTSFALAVESGVPWRVLGLVIVAMVGARSAAMGFNRLADHWIDARNPRTAGRELPRGLLTRAEVWLFVIVSAAALVGAAALLNPLCLALSPLALGIVFAYSYAKRFTPFSHLVLGVSLGIAPIGAWLAVRGAFALEPLLLACAVMCWVAGFDVIYACQDVDYDRGAGLHSLPARLGVAGALRVARGLHVAAVALLASLALVRPLHPVYLAGVAAVALLMLYEHSLVHPQDLSRVDAAFFNTNAWISVGYLATTLLAIRLG